MGISVFFDLETTDKNPIGQILNYSFIAIDDNWEPAEECSGLIRISRLQLPRAGAILANRVDVQKHQVSASDTEKDACVKIRDFLMDLLDKSDGDLRLIGFNSTKFDIPYLRTSFYRNGISPYLRMNEGGVSKKLINGDVLAVAQKLVTTSEEFALISLSEGSEGIKRNLKLQHLTQQLGLLEGTQTHESRDDVLLTIRLAKVLFERFGIDVRNWNSYEGMPYHRTSRSGKILLNLYPEYDMTKQRSMTAVPMILLDYYTSSSLWINLFDYQEGKGRDSIKYKNCNDAPFFLTEPSTEIQSKYQDIAKKALEEFKHISTKTYFTKSVCDIEMDIYRATPALDALTAAIWRDDRSQNKTEDGKELFKRHRLANYIWGSEHDDKVKEMLVQYAESRYSGKAILKKQYAPGDEVTAETFHPSIETLYDELNSEIAGTQGEDLTLMTSLKEFYDTSDIVKVLKEQGSKLIAKIK